MLQPVKCWNVIAFWGMLWIFLCNAGVLWFPSETAVSWQMSRFSTIRATIELAMRVMSFFRKFSWKCNFLSTFFVDRKWLIPTFLQLLQGALDRPPSWPDGPAQRHTVVLPASLRCAVTVMWNIARWENPPRAPTVILSKVYSCAAGRHDSGKYSLISFWHGRRTWEGFLL